MSAASRRVSVEILSRVEGETGMRLTIRDGRIRRAELPVFEPPRLFEGFLRGRAAAEAPDLTARVCGICPVAYQLTAAAAIEGLLRLDPGEKVRRLRRLLYCGEWIASHALHVTMLHAPDFLGFDSGIAMSREHPEAVARGLRLKKTGNAIVATVGGREVHPFNPKLGGFHAAPAREAIASLAGPLDAAIDDARALLRWVGGLPIPEFEQDYTFLALVHERDYPMAEGRVATDRGFDVDARGFEALVTETQVPHASALHAILRDGTAPLSGPLARWALNRDRLPADVRAAAAEAGVEGVCRNPFRAIVVRAAEILWACGEARRLVGGYEPPDPPSVEGPPRVGSGFACTEAPRGLLYHRYRVDERGTIREARIVPPTALNLRRMELDLEGWIPADGGSDEAALRRAAARLVRNHDPCISCATH